MDTPPYERWEVCPECNGSSIVDAFECDCCGEYITDKYVATENGERYCSECYVIKTVAD